MHKIVAHPACPGRLYLQNHGGFGEECPGGGVLRSDDAGDTWYSIARGLPSDFGFAMVGHPHDPDTVYVLPLEHNTRTCPGGAPAVYRSRDGGKRWKRLATHLPRRHAYFTVLRDAMDADDLATPGLYFGTTTGQVWASASEGERWARIADSLPPINSLKVAVLR